MLEELCGNRERAEFWTVFSNVTVALVPVIFAMQYQPEPGARALFEVLRTVEVGANRTGHVDSGAGLGRGPLHTRGYKFRPAEFGVNRNLGGEP